MKTYSQQIKERQDYTGFLAKGFYKDLMQELERLEQVEEEYAVIMELHHERI
jgi:hypothetical protein